MEIVWDYLKCLFWTAVGYVACSVFLPTVVFFWSVLKEVSDTSTQQNISMIEVVNLFVQGHFRASLLMMPLGLLFTTVVHGRILRRLWEEPLITFSFLAWLGASWGLAAAFFNVFAYFIYSIYTPTTDPLWTLRIMTMFCVTGATTGWWAAWQVWRLHHTVSRVWPQISLKWMLIVTIVAGGVLALFAPR